MDSLDRFAAGKLAALESKQLRRVLAEDARLDGLWVSRGGKKLLSFSCNDYLNLSHDARVKEAAAAAALAHGAGAGASRLVTGNHALVRALEARLAAFKGTEAACVFGAGYLANTGIIPTLVRDGDCIFIDELSHACMWAGAKLSDAEVISFEHNDMENLTEQLTRERGRHRHALVLSEGVFSMDGDRAPLAEMSALCAEHDAWLMIDDAHGLGVLGDGAGSVAEAAGAEVPLQMGTLSKALGSYGGYVCASAPVVDFLKTRARTLIYSTGLAPACAAAALAALDIIAADPDLTRKPLAQARRFTRALNLPEAQSPIVPVVLGSPERALASAAALEAQGFLVVAIRPPTVPEGTARLRFAFTAGHSDADIDRLAEAVRALIPEAA
jgi:8-amino-7-oxononanoate synthase